MGESYFWKPFAQGVATPIVLIGGTNLLLKDFKVSNPYLYWGGLATSSAIVLGILADKIKVPILNAESFKKRKIDAESYSDEVKAKVFDSIFEWHEQMQLQGEGIEYELDRMRWMLENPDEGYDDYPYTYEGQLREGFDAEMPNWWPKGTKEVFCPKCGARESEGNAYRSDPETTWPDGTPIDPDVIEAGEHGWCDNGCGAFILPESFYDAETFNSDSHTDSFMAEMPVNAERYGDGWYIPSIHRKDYKETFKNWKPSKYPYEKRITQDSVNEGCNSCGKENVHYQFYLARTNSVNPKMRFIDGATYCQYDPNDCGGNICGDCADDASCENCGAEICSYCEQENNYDHSDLVCVDCRESLEDD